MITIRGHILFALNKDIRAKVQEHQKILESLEARQVAPEKEDDEIRRAFSIKKELVDLGVYGKL